LCFATLKALLGAARERTVETLWTTVATCLTQVDAAECEHYFRHCGYPNRSRSGRWSTIAMIGFGT